jgi:hypothetical protein
VTNPPDTEYWRDWFEVNVSAELRQGDIFREMLAFWLPQDLAVQAQDPPEGAQLPCPLRFARGSWIVVSASCDVVRGDDTHVILSRVVEGTQQNLKAENPKAHREKLEVLRQGYDPARFLLARFDDITPAFPQSFVEFRAQTFLPLGYLKRHCDGPRLRLKPPFRERFGNWAASNLGRVGIEDSSLIPKITGFSASAVLRATDDPQA